MRFIVLAFALSFLLQSMAIAAPPSGSYDQKATIVHTNDVHSYVEIYPYVKGYVDSLKAAGENVVLISGGDAFAGTSFASVSNGIDVAKVMNMAGYEAMAVGNHEQLQSAAFLAGISKESTFPFLAANATDKLKALLPGTKDYIIKQFGQTKIAFIGLTCPGATGYGFGGDAAVTSAEKARDNAKAEGATVFVAVTHMGVTDPDTTLRSTYIADKCPWLSVIIDAHCHTAHKTGLIRNGVLICETGEYGINIGDVRIYLKSGAAVSAEAKLIQIKGTESSSGIKPDAEISKFIAGVKAKNDTYLKEIVTTVPVDLNGEKNFIRSRETNLGDVTADAMMWKTGTDFALIGGPYIRESIAKGKLTREKLGSAFFADTELNVINLSGKKIYELMENAVSVYPELNNNFMQIGGLRVIVDTTKKKGSRVYSLTDSKGTAIIPEKNYSLTILGTYLKRAVGENAVLGKDYTTGYGSAADAFVEYVNSGALITGLTDGRVKALSE